MALHAFESIVRRRRRGQAGDLRDASVRAEPQIAGEAELRIDLDDVRKLGEFLPRGFIERGRRRGRLRQAPAAGETSAALCGRSERVSWPHQHAIEKAGALQPTVDQLLQSDAEREHGH